MAATFFVLVTYRAAWSSFSSHSYASDVFFEFLENVYIKQIYKWSYIWLDLLQETKRLRPLSISRPAEVLLS